MKEKKWDENNKAVARLSDSGHGYKISTASEEKTIDIQSNYHDVDIISFKGKIPLMRKIHDKSSGFTLIEIMIAIFILTIALLGVAGVTVSVINGNAFSKEITTATTLAQDKMEEVKNLGYFGTPSSDTTTLENYGEIVDYPSYKRVTKIDVNSPAGMKTITVTVSWKRGDNTHNVTLKTIMAQ